MRNDPDRRNRKGKPKSPVIGAIERGGKVVAKFSKEVTTLTVTRFLLDRIDPPNTILMTDQHPVYNDMGGFVNRGIVNHSERYVNDDGVTHTNTIEGFWALIKRAWYGTHHNYSQEYMPLYIAEACYKYNNRNCENLFEKFMKGLFKK